jgi:cyclopropane-fatty-acyl-phospholipid synthase
MQKFEKFLHHLADLLDVDLSVELWSGEVIPLCRRPTSDLALRIADPGVIASLLRSSRMLKFISMIASGRLRLVNGTLFEFEPRRQAIIAKLRAGAWRRIDKRLMLSALAPFLMMSGKASIDDQAYKGESRGARDDKALVQFHYDLSNEFYALFLDPLMVYSCAYFPTFEASLEEAQRAKLDIICRKLRLKPNEKFLDIGCGWGGLVIHAAQNYGVIAHGATLSEKQFDYAKARWPRSGSRIA